MIAKTNTIRIDLIASCLLFVLVIIMYSPSVNVPFQYDDIHSIKENPHIQKLSNIPIFFHRADMFTADERSAMFRPVLLVSYALNFYFDGLRVNGFHWVNILVHSINSILLYWFSRKLGLQTLVAVFASFLFAFHPLNSETVNYISSRSESLSALFFLCTLFFYHITRSRVKFGFALYLSSIICFCLALLCKSVGIMIIPTVLFYEWTFFSRIGRPSAYKLSVPFAVFGICYVYQVRSMLEISFVSAPVRSMEMQLSTQLKALLQYIDWLFFPWPLSVEPGFTMGVSFKLGILCVVFLLSLFWLWWKADSITHFCFGWALFSILPTLLVPLNVLVNEHRLYIMTMTFVVALGSIVQQYSKENFAKICVGGIILLLIYCRLDFMRTKQWIDSKSLWQSAQKVGSQMPRPYIFLGDIDRQEGRYEAAIQNYTLALAVQRQALSGGDLFSIYSGIGSANISLGRWSEAEQSYLKALRIDPESESTKLALDGIRAFHLNNQIKKSDELLRQGLFALVSNQLDRAIDLLRKSVDFLPNARNLQALAKAHERAEQWQEAAIVYQRIALFENKKIMKGKSANSLFESSTKTFRDSL